MLAEGIAFYLCINERKPKQIQIYLDHYSFLSI